LRGGFFAVLRKKTAMGAIELKVADKSPIVKSEMRSDAGIQFGKGQNQKRNA
jgi:hypothetical protein